LELLDYHKFTEKELIHRAVVNLICGIEAVGIFVRDGTLLTELGKCPISHPEIVVELISERYAFHPTLPTIAPTTSWKNIKKKATRENMYEEVPPSRQKM
jgi:hypothetical protein